MAGNSTTRRGSGIPAGGVGHGGPKRGGASNSKAGKPGPGCLGVKPGEGKKVAFRALMAPHIEKSVKGWRAIIDDPKHPHHHTMILKHAELEGEFKQTVELGGPGGGSIPLSIGVTFVEPKRDEP